MHDFLCDPAHEKFKIIFSVMQRMHGLVFIAVLMCIPLW